MYYSINANSQRGVIVPDDAAGYLDGGLACEHRDGRRKPDRVSKASECPRCAFPNPRLMPPPSKVSRLANRCSSPRISHPETESMSCVTIIEDGISYLRSIDGQNKISGLN